MNKSNYKHFPITIGLIVACVVIYIYTSITYSMNMNGLEGYYAGGFMPLAILTNHEYTRFISANFIHFGLSHLLMNMISLFNIGPFMEQTFGKLRYVILICGSCIMTTLLPYLYFLVFENHYGTAGLTISGGASGIIFGLLGGLCFLALYYKGIFKQAFRSILPSLLLMLIVSVSVPSVSFSGHLGGFVGGFMVTAFIALLCPYRYWPKKYKKNQDVTSRPC